jgi:hypothetical protein
LEGRKGWREGGKKEKDKGRTVLERRDKKN